MCIIYHTAIITVARFRPGARLSSSAFLICFSPLFDLRHFFTFLITLNIIACRKQKKCVPLIVVPALVTYQSEIHHSLKVLATLEK